MSLRRVESRVTGSSDAEVKALAVASANSALVTLLYRDVMENVRQLLTSVSIKPNPACKQI